MPLRPVVVANLRAGRIEPAPPDGRRLEVARIGGVRLREALRLHRLARRERRFGDLLDPEAPERAVRLDDRSTADFVRLYFGPSVLERWAEPILGSDHLAEGERGEPRQLPPRAAKLISLTAEPDFIDLSKLKTAAPDQLIKIREVNAQLLNLTVAGNSIEGVSLLGTATRDNVAHVMPMYTIQDELSASVREYKAMLADFVFCKNRLASQFYLIYVHFCEVAKTNFFYCGGNACGKKPIFRAASCFLPLSYKYSLFLSIAIRKNTGLFFS